MHQQQTAIIEDAFSVYEKVQQEHLSTLQDGGMPDLALMGRQRDAAFKALKTSLDDYMINAGSSNKTGAINRLNGFQTRVADLMALDDQISNEIKKYKIQLMKNLNRVNKGKTALKGYKDSSPRGKGPRVLSMNR